MALIENPFVGRLCREKPCHARRPSGCALCTQQLLPGRQCLADQCMMYTLHACIALRRKNPTGGVYFVLAVYIHVGGRLSLRLSVGGGCGSRTTRSMKGSLNEFHDVGRGSLGATNPRLDFRRDVVLTGDAHELVRPKPAPSPPLLSAAPLRSARP